MSNLRRTLSQRYKKRSYSTLPHETDMFKTPPSKITPVKQLSRRPSTMGSNSTSSKATTSCTTSTPLSKDLKATASTIEKSKENQDKGGAFVGLSSVKSAILNIGQKLKGKRKAFKRIDESPRMVNVAYTTPRRSERLKAKQSPSPITLKMYTPFHIETPDLEDSFTHISKRKALADLNESPLAKTPRRMTRQVIDSHKEFSKALSSTHITTASGY